MLKKRWQSSKELTSWLRAKIWENLEVLHLPVKSSVVYMRVRKMWLNFIWASFNKIQAWQVGKVCTIKNGVFFQTSSTKLPFTVGWLRRVFSTWWPKLTAKSTSNQIPDLPWQAASSLRLWAALDGDVDPNRLPLPGTPATWRSAWCLTTSRPHPRPLGTAKPTESRSSSSSGSEKSFTSPCPSLVKKFL